MRVLAVLAIATALTLAGAASAAAYAQPASMNADQAYVRAVAYFETRFNAIRAEQAAADAKAAAETVALRAALKDAQRELAALKARDDDSARTVLTAFAAGDAGKGLDAAEAAARRAASDARARWLETAALAAPLDPQRAIAAYREALKIEADDPAALLALAGLLARTGDPGGAIAIARSLVGAAKPGVQAQAWLVWGRALEAQGAGPRAEGIYLDALKAAVAANDRAAALDARARLGALAQAAGIWPKAESLLKAALADAAALGDPAREADAATALAESYAARGLWAMATPLSTRALALYDQLGDPFGKAGALLSLGAADAARPAPGLAEVRFRDALRIYRSLGAQAGEAVALGRLADAVAAQNRKPEACATYLQAQGAYMRTGAGFSPEGRRITAALAACR